MADAEFRVAPPVEFKLSSSFDQGATSLDGSPLLDCFTNSQGLKLKGYRWVVDSPTAIVIAIHGIQTHCKFEYLRLPREPTSQICKPEDFPVDANAPFHVDQQLEKDLAATCSCSSVYRGSWVEAFNSKGITFCGLDLQGHGLSEGWRQTRCNVECFDDYARDVIQYVHLVVQSTLSIHSGSSIYENPECVAKLPGIYLMGISMGGCIVLRAVELMSKSDDFMIRNIKGINFGNARNATLIHTGDNDIRSSILSGCVCLAPMLSVEKVKRKPLNRLLLPFGAFLSKILPDIPVAAVVPNLLYPWIDTCKKKDKLVPFPSMIPARLSFECISAIKNTQDDSDMIPQHISLLLIHSKRDTLCEIEGTELFFNRFDKHPSKQFWKLESMWHCLTQEEKNEELASSTIDWMLKKCVGNVKMSKSHL
ncbi:phospholipase [Cardiosporidium cionae]|uniref:Phospholipase n=1 Tax=Cardiosporidium cionae TaxID=476202 RepID=A0ABQ7J7C7_9APIC|nr:phospholipase [Cardiosporidium cionae]|eukprot:KAF8819883.1 phospholipase [Cardiosporidium cionae]